MIDYPKKSKGKRGSSFGRVFRQATWPGLNPAVARDGGITFLSSISRIPVTVNSVASTRITCSITIPAGTPTGYWKVVVTNLDGQSGTKLNGFSVRL